MSFQQGLSGLNATAQNLRDHRQQHRQRQHLRHQDGARRVRRPSTPARSTAAARRRSASAPRWPRWPSSSPRATSATTENPLDLAINGAGFFQITDGSSPPVYTRNGQFKVDRDGYIVNNAGMRLHGLPRPTSWASSSRGRPVALKLPTGGISPAPTTEVHDRAEPRLAARGDAARERAADRLQRRRDLQQRHLADGLRRQGPGSRADLLLPEDRPPTPGTSTPPPTASPIAGTAAGTGAASTTIEFPADGSAPQPGVRRATALDPSTCRRASNALGAETDGHRRRDARPEQGDAVRRGLRRHRPDARTASRRAS